MLEPPHSAPSSFQNRRSQGPSMGIQTPGTTKQKMTRIAELHNAKKHSKAQRPSEDAESSYKIPVPFI